MALLSRRARRLVLVPALVLFSGAQLIRPARTNPRAEPELSLASRAQLPPAVERTLARACADCHSNETRWPWYSQVAPVSWFVIDHANHGRSHLNFSSWGSLEAKRRGELLAGICDQAKARTMPVPSYLWIHRDARLTEADVAALCEWTAAEVLR
jgi:hypothetical protein